MGEVQTDNPITTKTEVEVLEKEEEQLPPLSKADFATYNQLAEKMNYFHNHFRQAWTLMYDAATSGSKPRGMSISQFIRVGTDFSSSLNAHHGIEEAHMFPKLAVKMPAFQKNKNNPAYGQMVEHHKQIHKGLEILDEYLKACKKGETEFRMSTLKDKMDTFGDVLWTHLDQEVEQLGAENMRKYWTLQEMRRLPFAD